MPIGIGGCMSTSSPKKVTGWHVLNINGYSRTKGLPRGRSIESSTFTVGGHSWYISYFPCSFGRFNGWDSESIGVQLNLHNPAASDEVLTQFNISVLENAGGRVHSPYLESDTIYTFSSKNISHGVSGIIKKTYLESLFVKDDSFKIRCDVSVIKDIHAEDDPVAELPPPDLQRHLGDLLDSKVGGDVTFDVNGELLTAHRYVLAARSSVFMAQLFGPMKEKTASHVRIDDMDARVFKVMLRFIYTDMLMLPDMDDDEKAVMTQHLLVGADRYHMERLKLLCEDILRKQINTDIVATTLVLAEQHGCFGLKEACFKFLMSPGNLKTVMASDGFQHLKNSCPSLLDELLAKVAP